MRVAIAATPALSVPGIARSSTAQLWRLAGLLLAVAVPTLVWTGIVALVGNALGMAPGPITLAVVAATVGLCSAIGAAAVMASGPSRT
jgi:hypothetical protein